MDDETLINLVSDAFTAESAARHREPHQMGISSLGRCTRRLAHQVAGTDPANTVEPREGRAANLGTWQHNGLLPRMAALIEGAKTEVDVKLRAAGITIRGHADLVAPGIVVDLKTIGEHRLQAVRRSGATPEHIMQVAAYGVALLQSGHQVTTLALIYMDRTNGDVETIIIPFTNRLAVMVIDRVTEIVKAAEDPDSTPRTDMTGSTMLGPGYGYSCNECPWLKRCWGKDAEPFERQPRQFDRPKIEMLLEEYEDARTAESSARQRKAELMALLSDAEHGVYGDLRFSRDRDSRVDDGAASIRRLKDLGLPVPTTWRKGAVRVRRVKGK